MASARPLRDVFADLTGGGAVAGDPDALLRDHGHPALPDHLVAEAVISYADTAPVEVAEHLAPYVTAHSAVGADELPGDEPPADWLDLLGTAPADAGLADEPGDIDDLAPALDGFGDAADLGPDPGLGLDFGTGADPAPTFDAGDGTDDHADAGPDDHGDVVDVPADGGLADVLPDPAGPDDGDAAGWLDTDDSGDPSTVDDADPEPDDDPLG
jgi:hypothetical protein